MAGVCLLLGSVRVHADAVSSVGAVLHPLNQHDSDSTKGLTTFADGPRLVPSGGGFWFLEANADRIAYFNNDVITEWPIRSRSYPAPYNHIGASPADFELDPDGTTIWFMENGTSGIDLQQSVFGKLDTTTGLMTEWIMPISKPSGFLREPDGVTVWVAMSQGSLLRINLETLAVDSFRAPDSMAYSGLISGSGGLFYLLDFGNNRVVQVDPVSLSETSWQTLDPTKFHELPTQPSFDASGNLWFAEEVNGGAFGRLNLATGQLDRFGSGFLLSPSHYFLQGDLIYGVETDPTGGDGRVVVLDQTQVSKETSTLAPKTAAFTSISSPALLFRTFTLTSQTFQSKDDSADGVVVASAPTAGLTRFTLPHGSKYPTTTSYSITVEGGKILAGVRGALAEFTLLPPALPTDLVVPLALNDATGVVRTDFLFHTFNNAATSNLTAVFYSSPLPPPDSKAFSFPAKSTLLLSNAIGSGGLGLGTVSGALQFFPDVADTGGYRGLTRTYAFRSDGGTYGYSLPALPVSSGLVPGSSRALFFSAEPGETTSFGIFSPTGALGTATLHGPDGGLRGTYSFLLPSNNRVEFNPAASAFGASAESGDYVTFDIASGTIFPYAVFQEATQDVAVGVPVPAASDLVFPLLGSGEGAADTQYVSEILLANPDPANEVVVNTALYPLDPSATLSLSSVTVPAGGTATISFDSGTDGFGSLLLQSSEPVHALARSANRTSTGDYAGLALPLFSPGVSRFLVSGNSLLRTNLCLFNRGTAGTVTLQGFDATGTVTGILEVPVGDHQPFFLEHAAAALQIRGAGRIRVLSDEGMALYSWLTTADTRTGDPDIQASMLP